jgi:hypothetical protein
MSLPFVLALLLVLHKSVRKLVGALILQDMEEKLNIRLAPRAADIETIPVRRPEVNETGCPLHNHGFARRHGLDFLGGFIDRTGEAAELRRIPRGGATGKQHRRRKGALKCPSGEFEYNSH